jgi:hypothetical protein
MEDGVTRVRLLTAWSLTRGARRLHRSRSPTRFGRRCPVAVKLGDELIVVCRFGTGRDETPPWPPPYEGGESALRRS